MKRFLSVLVVSASFAAASASAAVVFSYSGGIASWVVPDTGIYQIIGAGAEGGGAGGGVAGSGGLGAEVGGDLQLTAGETLDIVVGGQGQKVGDLAWGGGGGTWLFVPGAANPILVAGGGGGEDWFGGDAGNGQVTTSGGAGTDGSSAGGVGGSGGQGGGAGGGAGWLSDGGGGGGIGGPEYAVETGGSGPPSFAGGVTMGQFAGPGTSFDEASGGFGGGGGAGLDGGGGGGGYSGGGADEGSTGGGGGGGSYLDGDFTNVVGLSGAQEGNGWLSISEISSVPEPGDWSLLVAGLGLVGWVLRRRKTWVHGLPSCQ